MASALATNDKKEDYRKLTGSQKAAIVLMAIDEDNATKILGTMSDEERHEPFVAYARRREQGHVSVRPVDRRAGPDRPTRGVRVPRDNGNPQRFVARGLTGRPRPNAIAGKHQRRACQDDQAAKDLSYPSHG